MSCASAPTDVNPANSGGFRRLLAVFRGFPVCDLLDEVDDAAPKFRVGNARERARERKSLGGREKIGDIGWRGALGRAVAADGTARAAIEQKRYRHLQHFRNL